VVLGGLLGIDLSDPGFWDAGLALIEDQLAAAEGLAERFVQ
jgi:oligoendopeptidase F